MIVAEQKQSALAQSVEETVRIGAPVVILKAASA